MTHFTSQALRGGEVSVVTSIEKLTGQPDITVGLWPGILLPAVARQHANALAALPDAAWSWLATQSLQHGVAPLLYSNVGDLPLVRAQEIPELVRLRKAHRHSALLALQRSGELCRILDALAAVDIRPAVFKGAALAYALYATPAARPMGDIDLWVTQDETHVAIAALEGLGYSFHEKQHRPHALTRTTDGEVQMRPGRPNQSLVELHWGVYPGEWLARTTAIDRTGIRNRLVPAPLLNRDVLLLTPEDALIQLAVHIAINHQMTVNALRSLVDVALVSEQDINWDVVVQRALAWRVATVVGQVLALTHQLFGLPVLAAPAAALAPGPVQALMLRRFLTPATVLNGTQISAHKGRFAYLLCVTDRPVDSLRLLAHTVWPAPAWLAARYGRSGWAVRLSHATRALRGNI